MSTATTAQTAASSTNDSKYDAYGKVKVFKDSKLKQLLHLDEVWAMILVSLFELKSHSGSNYIREHFDADNLEFVEELMAKTECIHWGCLTIRLLPGPVYVDVLVLIEALRAIDVIEDDVEYYKDNLDGKIEAMLSFTEKALMDPNWSFEGIGDSPGERQLMKDFPRVHNLYKALRPVSQKEIAKCSMEMAKGMAEFLLKDLSQGFETMEEHNYYTYITTGRHYECVVAAHVDAGLEDPSFNNEKYLMDRLGRFCYQSHAIFSVSEDLADRRVKWPQEIWKQYSATGKVEYFFDNLDDPVARAKSIQCVNAMVTFALEMVPDCLEVAGKIKCYEHFRWIALLIGASMAQHDLLYANENVFRGNVLVRKGKICQVLLKTHNLEQLHGVVHHYAESILKQASQLDPKIKENDPGYQKTQTICKELMRLTAKGAAVERQRTSYKYVAILGLVAVLGWVGLFGVPSVGDLTAGIDKALVASAMFTVAVSPLYFAPAPDSSLRKCGNA